MSRKSRKAAKLASLEAARLRASNGSPREGDVDMLIRMRREAVGLNGHTGYPRSSSGSGSSSSSNNSSGSNDKGDYQWSRGGSMDYSRDWRGQGSRGGYGYQSQGGYQPKLGYQPKEDGIFCVESSEVTSECPLKPKVPSILVDAQIWEVWLNCTREYDTEWIALLIGSLGKDSKGDPAYIIDKFYFPPQTATGSHVDVPVEARPRPGTIGAIHSHVDMGVFFSGTDKAHSNWPVEIVINRKREYEAVARHQLKCGEWAKSKAKVYVTGSFIPVKVKGELDQAFSSGLAIEQAARASSKVLSPDRSDRSDPKQAGPRQGLLELRDSSPNSKFPPMPEGAKVDGWEMPCTTVGCGHSLYIHYFTSGRIHGCAVAGCGCMKYSPTASSTSIIKVEDKVEDSKEPVTVIDLTADDGSSMFEALGGYGEAHSEAQDDPYSCKPCEGLGCIETEVSGIKELVECPTCGGSGLNQVGLDYQAQTGILL